MRKIFMLACAMLLSAAIWANPITLVNNTCAPITYALFVYPTSGSGYAYGFKVLNPSTTVSYANPSDFLSDPTVTNISNTIPTAQLPTSNFMHLRFWDNQTMTGLVLDPNVSGSSGFSLPCSGMPYNFIWGGSTIIMYP